MIIEMEPNATEEQIQAVVVELGGRKSYITRLCDEGSAIVSFEDESDLNPKDFEALPGVVKAHLLPVEIPKYALSAS